MAKDYDYPSYDAGGRVKKHAGDYDVKKIPNKDLKYSGHSPNYQKYLDKQDFGTAFKLTKDRYDKFEWRGKVYTTQTKDQKKKK